VVTWNLWWRFGPWDARQQAILTALREVRPDLIGLQEVWARDEDNLAGWLADKLGMYWTWAPSPAPQRWQNKIGDAEVEFGNAVLSAWPILDQAVISLPHAADDDDGRLVLHTRLDTPGAPVPFFTTQLTSAVDASSIRRVQVAALAEFVAAHSVETSFPPVITGDFNAWPDSDEIRLLGGYKTASAVPGQVLFDVWEYADPALPSATWNPRNPFVPDYDPPVRIDYIFVGPPGPGGLGHVRSVARIGDGPVDGIWPSDHAGVAADLAERPSPG
jgi:endonuclease/exonuclease/phosphatase family metal-dependent hydrolase